ncbi:hypothetical protein [Aquimarina rhabdastrellae]
MWIIEVNNEIKSFLVIEPSFYDELDLCDDFTMKCLEVLRRELPSYFNTFPNGTTYGLIRYGDFLGNQYPAIGIQCKNQEDYDKIPDFIDLYNGVEILINEIGLEEIKEEAKFVDTITWNDLKEIGWYFEKYVSE